MSDQMREEFEKWYLKDTGFGSESLARNDIGSYIEDDAISCWEGFVAGWQASSASLCVELPDEIGVLAMLEEYDPGYNSAINDCREAITKTGVRVK